MRRLRHLMQIRMHSRLSQALRGLQKKGRKSKVIGA